MKFKAKIIKTARELKSTKVRFDELLTQFDKGHHESLEELDLLSLVIDKYESETFSFAMPSLADAIKFQMKGMKLDRKELASILGSNSRVSEVLNGKKGLSKAVIKRVHNELKIPYEILMQDPEPELDDSFDINPADFPFSEMVKRDYFAWYSGTKNQMKSKAKELLEEFFGTAGDKLDLQTSLLRSSVTQPHLRSKKQMNKNNLLVWKACVLIKAQEDREVKAKFDPKLIDEDFLSGILRLSRFKNGPLLAKQELAEHGIHLVHEKHYAKTYLDGAVMFSNENRPIVGITARYDRLDNFWFVLMHELGHIACGHLYTASPTIYDDLDGRASDVIEKQADKMALKALMSENKWKNEVLPYLEDADDLLSFSRKFRVNPAIIAGRYRKETGDYTKFNHWVGSGEVRKLFE